MIPYQAPVEEMRFLLDSIVGLDRLADELGFAEVTAETVGAILEEAARLAAGVLAPLNQPGDRIGARYRDGVVTLPEGFREAYARYRDGGWNGLAFDPDHGGQGLPWALAAAVQEMWLSANCSFGLCPLLNQSCVELLQVHGDPAQKRLYLPRLISGEWTGTMNLTEPQAGSDLGALRTRAERDGDAYRLFGQKIYITYGEHDLSENIIHMVLARLPDAPPGVRGISLFIVPKQLPDPAGRLGQRNDVRCLSIEQKMGIHASPTCVMAFGEAGGAVGFLVGRENQGLAQMFTMMNHARLSVGLQGVALAERAYQQARDFARERVQSREMLDVPTAHGERAVTIVHHPDVRRMLMTMKALTASGRALSYLVAGLLDEARRHPDPGRRQRAQAEADLMIPVAKIWCTEAGVEVASTGIQVHGGMGYVEDTGAAQHLRDARIATIYEGTTGIQANDLVFRKILRDGGAVAQAWLDEQRSLARRLGGRSTRSGDAPATIAARLDDGLLALSRATQWVLEHGSGSARAVAAGAVPYARMFGAVAGAAVLARAGLAAMEREADGALDRGAVRARLLACRFFAETRLPGAAGLLTAVTESHHGALAYDEAEL